MKNKTEMLALGIDNYISKPLLKDRLIELISIYLNQ